MKREVIVPATSGKLPERVYSPAIRTGNVLYVSGQTGSDFVTKAFEPDIESQTHRSLGNIKAIVEAAGGTLADVAKVNVYMVDMPADFAKMNAVFKQYFPTEPPARCTVGVAHLARPGLLLEIEAIAVLRDQGDMRPTG